MIEEIKKLGVIPAVGIRHTQRKEAKVHLRKEWLEEWGRWKKCSWGSCFVEFLHVGGAFIFVCLFLVPRRWTSAFFSERLSDTQGLLKQSLQCYTLTVMHHLTEEQVAKIKQLLTSLREKVLSSAQEQIRDPSNVVFEGGDEVDRANVEAGRYISLQRIKTRELKLLRKIDYALYKMEVGTYGICESCGASIPFERLMARPVTTMCINCKEFEEEKEHE